MCVYLFVVRCYARVYSVRICEGLLMQKSVVYIFRKKQSKKVCSKSGCLYVFVCVCICLYIKYIVVRSGTKIGSGNKLFCLSLKILFRKTSVTINYIYFPWYCSVKNWTKNRWRTLCVFVVFLFSICVIIKLVRVIVFKFVKRDLYFFVLPSNIEKK